MKKQELIWIIITIFTLVNITWSICNKTRSNELNYSANELEQVAIDNQNVSDSLNALKRFIEMESNKLNRYDIFSVKGGCVYAKVKGFDIGGGTKVSVKRYYKDSLGITRDTDMIYKLNYK